MKVRKGSGPFAASDGLAVTCRHVVTGNPLIQPMLLDGTEPKADVVDEDEDSDLALLQAKGMGYAALPITDRAPAVGEKVKTWTRHGKGKGWSGS